MRRVRLSSVEPVREGAPAVGSLMIRRTSRPGDLAGVLGRLPLRVVEVRRER